MVLVIANVFVKDGSQATFIESAKKCVAETLKEDGNISYELKASVENNCIFTFVEQWESKDALNLHMNTEHFKTFGASIQDLLAKDLEINIYKAEKFS